MFRNIMVGLDGSAHGQAALAQSLELARSLNAQLTGVHVVDDRLLKGSLLYDFSGSLGLEPQFHLTGRLEAFMERRAESLLIAFREACEAAGVPCRELIPQGEVDETLMHVAEQHDLVVVGRRGASFDVDPHESERGIARRLLKHSPIRVLITGLEVSRLENLVVAFDGSFGAVRALADAAVLATLLDRPLTVCHVVDSGATPPLEPLALAERYLEPYKLTCRFETREGAPVTALAAFVESHRADLLFVGYFGRSRLRELFSGHTPEALLNWVPCPLWIAR